MKVLASNAFLAGRHFLRCSGAYQRSSSVAAVRSQVDDMVSTFNDLHVMLDDYDGVSAFYQRVESVQQAADIVKVQSRGRLVKDEEGRLLSFLSDEIGQFHTLVLTP